MLFSNLEDAYGTPFGQRVPITQSGEAEVSTQDSIDKKAENKEKLKELVAKVSGTLPLDTNHSTRTFNAGPTPLPDAPLDPRVHVNRAMLRENFTMGGVPTGGGDDSKLDRILRLVEQNKTGYEPAATQDMLLYIATGVFFLFTFDTFVSLGKAMRGR